MFTMKDTNGTHSQVLRPMKTPQHLLPAQRRHCPSCRISSCSVGSWLPCKNFSASVLGRKNSHRGRDTGETARMSPRKSPGSPGLGTPGCPFSEKFHTQPLTRGCPREKEREERRLSGLGCLPLNLEEMQATRSCISESGNLVHPPAASPGAAGRITPQRHLAAGPEPGVPFPAWWRGVGSATDPDETPLMALLFMMTKAGNVAKAG